MKKDEIPLIEIHKSGVDELYFSLQLPNDGVFVSRFFKDTDDVIKAIKNIKSASPSNKHYDRKLSSTGQSYFVFRMKWDDPFGQSSMFNLASAMEDSLLFMREHFISAGIVDLTDPPKDDVA